MLAAANVLSRILFLPHTLLLFSSLLDSQSWGSAWGENGYARIKRGSGKKGQEGVCGIARSPSVALGGILLPESGIATTNIMNHNDNDLDQTERMETSLVYNHCESFGMGHVRLCNRVEG